MIIYHHNDLDGIASAALVYNYLSVRDYFLNENNIKLKMMDYDYDNINFDDEVEHDEEVFILDFCFKPDEILKLINITKNIIWIDHHKTSIQRMDDANISLNGLRSDTYPSAVALVWKYIYKTEPSPCVKMISDYDTWKHNYDDNVLNFISGLHYNNYLPDDKAFARLLLSDSSNMICEIANIGKMSRDIKLSNDTKIISSIGYNVKFEGMKGLAVNLPMCNSLSFKEFAEKDYEIWIPFKYNGNKWIVSLYQNKCNKDLGKIATKYGGGGHPGAAGFTCSELPDSLEK